MKDFLAKGYELYADNYYNSVKLFDQLGKRRTHACGVFRKDRENIPKKKMKKASMQMERSKRCLYYE